MTQIVPSTTVLKNDGVGVADLDTAIATAAAATMEFNNDGNLLLFVKNGSASPVTLTVKANQGDADGRGGTANDKAMTVAAGDIAVVPFLNPRAFNNSGQAQVTLSDVTTVTYVLYRLEKTYGGL